MTDDHKGAMTDQERNEVLATLRRSLYVTTSATGRRQVRTDLTREERQALREALDAELAALRACGFTFGDADVRRPFDALAVVSANGGETEIVVDPLNLLPLLAESVPADDPLARRH